jgi:hypothetical protein
MSVMLSAASCLDWAAKLTGLGSVPALIAAAQSADDGASGPAGRGRNYAPRFPVYSENHR